MASSTRILFVSGEVPPFAAASPLAERTRALAASLQNIKGLDARLMMPCYGSIRERKHRLHEVIRLSGTEVPMGDDVETLTVKVSSLPEAGMQVYFMDHDDYFDREGVLAGDDGTPFDDNNARALFFARAVLETLRTLRWRPDVIHAFGWMGGLVPLLLDAEYAEDELLQGLPVVYTPDTLTPEATVPASLCRAAGLESPCTTQEAGLQAHAVIAPPEYDAATDHTFASEDRASQLLTLYESLMDEVPV